MQIIPVPNRIIASQYHRSDAIAKGIIVAVVLICASILMARVLVGFFTDPDPFYDTPKEMVWNNAK